jgi:uncharacterized protein YgiM (DUF1202 family)
MKGMKSNKEANMNRSFRLKWFMVGIVVLFVAVLLAENLIVKVQTTSVREEPKFYSPVLATLKAGESVTQISAQAGWFKVRTSGGVEGWIHSSAVRTKSFTLAAMDETLRTQATAEEVALAGKGFNKQVEEEYKSRNKGLNFAEVDRMLRIIIKPEELRKFLERGRLGEFGGPQ